jgi:hypothetical protein
MHACLFLSCVSFLVVLISVSRLFFSHQRLILSYRIASRCVVSSRIKSVWSRLSCLVLCCSVLSCAVLSIPNPHPNPRFQVARTSTSKVTQPTPDEIAKILCSDPATLSAVIKQLPPETKRAVGLQWAIVELENEFAKADKNRDEKLSFQEFSVWAKQVVDTGPSAALEQPTSQQLRNLFITTMVPYMGFGITDNALMVISGDMIDHYVGSALGLSMLGSAAMGNSISNGTGMVFHGTIERFAMKLGLPDPRLTLHQRSLSVVQNVRTAAGITGVLVGCWIGMFPLIFID